MAKKPSTRGRALGASLGITDNTLFDVMCSQYRAAGYHIETGGQPFEDGDKRGPSYLFLECHNPKEDCVFEGDKCKGIVHYFTGDGSKITEVKVLFEVVTDVVIEKEGKYVM